MPIRTISYAIVCYAVLLATALSHGQNKSASGKPSAATQPAVTLEQMEQDWLLQDLKAWQFRPEAIAKPLAELGKAGADLSAQHERLRTANVPDTDARWRELYRKACMARRAQRLAPHAAAMRRLVFIKRPYELGGSHYAYTEGLSDAAAERHFAPRASLCILELPDPARPGAVRTLIYDPQGTLRDPDVSYDGKRILFSWKKSDRKDDFHVYEMTAADSPQPSIRQITSGLGYADYEGAYLPNGDLVFNSSRCQQIVDCWYTEVSNLYTCAPDGRFLRRLSYDQVHTNFPTVTPTGEVIYTRWDYNDRGQLWPQGLLQMNPDGTSQTEFYGNNSWFPTTLMHARAIPGTGKVVAIFSGHHSLQKGWLGIVDPAMGRQENQGAQLIAPLRPTDAPHIDGYGQRGDQYQYPYPLSERAFLVTLKPDVSNVSAPADRRMFDRFGLYFIDIDGRRELLAYDREFSCTQAIPLRPRPVPPIRASTVDYTKDTGTIYMQDVYRGPGLAGVPRGTIKGLRVVALRYRAATAGSSTNGGPAGSAYVSSPISLNGAWDVKVVLGTAKVHDDGSACFEVPARTPVYFQPLDAHGRAVQTMRSWATLQPGERFSCVGCHESKNAAPKIAPISQALRGGPRKLTQWYGPPRGFSFHREVQPVLDRHCVACHSLPTPAPGAPFHLERARDIQPLSPWRYTLTAPPANWAAADFNELTWKSGEKIFSRMDKAYNTGNNLWQGPQIWLRATFDLPPDIPMTSLVLSIDTQSKVDFHINGQFAAGLNHGLVLRDPKTFALFRPGRNVLALRAHDSPERQFIQVRLQDLGYRPAPPRPMPAGANVKPAFSLRGAPGAWSDAYLTLANRNYCTWTSPQSQPNMLPPYDAGANKSKLIAMLEKGHNGVKLSPEEFDRLSTWIDLCVPCFGDYTEGVHGAELEYYNRLLAKRTKWEEQEQRNIQDFIKSR